MESRAFSVCTLPRWRWFETRIDLGECPSRKQVRVGNGAVMKCLFGVVVCDRKEDTLLNLRLHAVSAWVSVSEIAAAANLALAAAHTSC